MAAIVLVWSARDGFAADSCKEARARLAVCEPANVFVIHWMRTRHLEAISVAQDVVTGALVVFAASRPHTLDVSTQVPPLSLSKLFLSASWWDNRLSDLNPESANDKESVPKRVAQKQVDVHEMLVSGSDFAGRQLALALRSAVGTKTVAADLQRYGFNHGDEPFWAEVDPRWTKRLTPQPAYALMDALSDEEWSSALSIGESHMMTTALHISRFLQAVGNNGLLCPPIARRMTAIGPALKQACSSPTRMLGEATARQLAAAMLDGVKRGTATRIAGALVSTGWTIGGKTGTGGILEPRSANRMAGSPD